MFLPKYDAAVKTQFLQLLNMFLYGNTVTDVRVVCFVACCLASSTVVSQASSEWRACFQSTLLKHGCRISRSDLTVHVPTEIC